MDYRQRVERLRAGLPWDELRAALVTDLVNVGYLTGFWGHEPGDGWVLITKKKTLIISDGRYGGTLRELGWDFVFRPPEGGWAFLKEYLPAGAAMGFEQDLPYRTWRKLEQELAGTTLVPLEDNVEDLRRIKDADEATEIRQAAAFTDQVLQEALSFIHPGRTELEVAAFLNRRLREVSGTDELAFATIVASGKNGDTPHAVPGARVIGPGEFVTIDLGARNGPYHSDMTRTVLTGGKEPDARLREVYDRVLEAQLAGLSRVAPGTLVREVDAAARTILAQAGLGEYFSHGTGHGVGLQIHEAPSLSPRSPEKLELQAGNVVTVEPGVYIPELGGVRIEDLVLVTNDGCEVLSHSPKELLTVG
jgi:Xaa-Pro aminopeptidase